MTDRKPPPTPCRGLTIAQPEASQIAGGKQWVVNRSAGTAYRGRIAIHAGRRSSRLDSLALRFYMTGRILAIAHLVHVTRIDRLRSRRDEAVITSGCDLTVGQVLNQVNAIGPWLFVLEEIRPLEPPIAWPGAGGLWEWLPPAGLRALPPRPLKITDRGRRNDRKRNPRN